VVGAELYEFDIRLPGILRYPVSIYKTLACLATENPLIIFAQNPSIILACLVVIYANLSGKKVIIDAHNAGLFPAEGKHRSLNWLASKLFRWTTITIVTNEELARYVEKLEGNAISIPDPIPEIERPGQVEALKGAYNILFICSWADDEPFVEVLRAAASMDEGTCIYITGNSKGKEHQTGQPLPGNVVLTGYISEQQFNNMLFACDAVMVLTTRENCLLCGAYEGVAAGKPLLLSNTRALRNYFSRGAVYAENTVESITDAIKEITTSHHELADEIMLLRDMRRNEYPHLISELEQEIASS
jgi:glycosyltransferase involved in cell wall biosynthesis